MSRDPPIELGRRQSELLQVVLANRDRGTCLRTEAISCVELLGVAFYTGFLLIAVYVPTLAALADRTTVPRLFCCSWPQQA
jgi:hypothetical protein